ncbi:MAG: glycerol-3-phosphate ABC transporter ATP-binding protein [Hyphomicrobiales bacterium]|nr:MAG: glycerol-3-phosphate ABC transporter ATP-binding protein [Hyphomicrobiales bacterium]
MIDSTISLSKIVKKFDATPVLRNVDLNIESGEFLTLVGPSGCGKSTLLRIIAGLEMQDTGSVFIGGRSVDHLRPKQRDVAMVFQSYALYPHMTVAENITMPLLMQRMSFAQRFPVMGRWVPGSQHIQKNIRKEVETVAEHLHIEKLLERKPGQLSGGQRQRVALGRAMVRRPLAFLMDEPLSNLDARLRVKMRTELAELHQRLGTTFIYVTHDQVEAMTMSKRIAVMMDGEIVQLGTPDEVYNDPQDIRVAQFIGSPPINILPGEVNSAGNLSLFGVECRYRINGSNQKNVKIGVRPEDLQISEFKVGLIERGGLRGWLRRLENLGNEYIAHIDMDCDDGHWQIAVRFPPEELNGIGQPGAAVNIFLNEAKIFVFSETGDRLSGEAMLQSAVEKAS